MALADLYSEKAFSQCDQECPSLDTSEKKEPGKTQHNVEKIDWSWKTTSWTELEPTWKSCQGQGKVVIYEWDFKGLSQLVSRQRYGKEWHEHFDAFWLLLLSVLDKTKACYVLFKKLLNESLESAALK